MTLDKQRPYLDEAWLETEFVVKGRTLRDIAEPYGVSFQWIGQLVKRFRLMEKRNALYKAYTNKEWLAGEFVDKRRIRQSIADECGVRKETISFWVRRYGLKREPFTKEERTQRNVARQIRLYATDPEYRRKKLERTLKWQQENPERVKKHHHDYYERHKIRKGGNDATG